MATPVRMRPITDWNDVPVLMDLPMAARVIGLTERTLKSHCAKGIIPAVKVGGTWRINKGELMRMLGTEV